MEVEREGGRGIIADLFHSFRELEDAERILESSELKHTVLKFKEIFFTLNNIMLLIAKVWW